MMTRSIALLAAAASLAVAPVAAQAAPQRAPAPVADTTEQLGGGSMILPLIGLVGLIIVLYLAIDSEDELPDSP